MQYDEAVLYAKEIYDKLEDEDSRIIYRARVEFLFDRNRIEYLKKMESTSQIKDWIDDLFGRLQKDGRRLFLFGAGADGITFVDFLHRHNILPYAFCDNNKSMWGSMVENVRVISPEQMLSEFEDDIIVITTTRFVEEVKEQLGKLSVYPSNMIELEPFLNPYFDVFEPKNNEVFIDAGCYDGQTTIAFTKWCNKKYKKAYAFEPNADMKEQCMQNFHKYSISNIELVEKGAWSCTERLVFQKAGQGSAVKAGAEGADCVDVTSIDEVLSGEAATFIKMDIEGSELQALKGAEETIQKYHPKLAICIYHKPDDILLIPAYIHSLVPDYHYQIRQYGLEMRETVFYAYVGDDL